MAQVGDVYQVRLFSEYLQEPIVNIFHYAVTVAPTDVPESADVISQFRATVMNLLIEVTSTGMRFDRVEAYNIRDVVDFDSVLFAGQTDEFGKVSGEALPAFFNYKYQYQRVAVGQRYGYKRFCGVPESFVDGNNVSATGQTLVNDLAVELGRTLVTTTSAEAVPYVARRPIVVGINPPGYGTNKARFLGFSTQNSRKN